MTYRDFKPSDWSNDKYFSLHETSYARGSVTTSLDAGYAMQLSNHRFKTELGVLHYMNEACRAKAFSAAERGRG